MPAKAKKEQAKIIGEASTVTSLYYHLSQLYPDAVSKPIPVDDDRPDYWMTINQIKYAVEVTGIIDENHYAYEGQAKDLVRAVNSRFQNSANNSSYDVKFTGRPDLPKKNSKEWDKLASSIVVRVGEIPDSPLGEPHRFEELKQINLVRTSDEGHSVCPRMPFEGSKRQFTTEKLFRIELSKLMSKSLSRKANLLREKGIRKNSILAWYNTFLDAISDDIVAAFVKVAHYDEFHSIYIATQHLIPNVVLPNIVPNPFEKKQKIAYGFFLYSSNSGWR